MSSSRRRKGRRRGFDILLKGNITVATVQIQLISLVRENKKDCGLVGQSWHALLPRSTTVWANWEVLIFSKSLMLTNDDCRILMDFFGQIIGCFYEAIEKIVPLHYYISSYLCKGTVRARCHHGCSFWWLWSLGPFPTSNFPLSSLLGVSKSPHSFSY